jgi:hypothetical protein
MFSGSVVSPATSMFYALFSVILTDVIVMYIVVFICSIAGRDGRLITTDRTEAGLAGCGLDSCGLGHAVEVGSCVPETELLVL